MVVNGGTVGSDMPDEPAKSGYTFSGWHTAQNGGGAQFTGSTTVTGNITVYAKWTCTVSFDADGGIPTTQTRTVNIGGTVGSSNMPAEPTRNGYTFGGWHTSTGGNGSQFTASTTVTANITVYAKWTLLQAPSNLSLEESLTWISNNAVESGVYAITLTSDETIAPQTLSYDGKSVGVTLEGGTSERVISLSATGSLFTVGSGVTLTLGGNVTLQGRTDNTTSLVMVYSGGTLVMNTGSKISGNTNSGFFGHLNGGGVNINNNSVFTMNGGEISGNTVFNYPSSTTGSSYGGGVSSSGVFTMNGGKISGNTASAGAVALGGGVYVGRGVFAMNGGEISGNTASPPSSSRGGGVYVDGGATFTKQTGGVIYGSDAAGTLQNTAGGGTSYGHAVYVSDEGKKRNTTAGAGITLDSSVSGSVGGWE
jgi:uncharacterized repeat protein (TIGR02543 family)